MDSGACPERDSGFHRSDNLNSVYPQQKLTNNRQPATN